LLHNLPQCARKKQENKQENWSKAKSTSEDYSVTTLLAKKPFQVLTCLTITPSDWGGENPLSKKKSKLLSADVDYDVIKHF